MAGKTFIISSQGFYAGSVFDKPNRVIVHSWTKKLSDALPLKGNRAKDVIAKYEFDAFIWSPFSEEPQPTKFEVKYVDEWSNFESRSKYWSPIRVYEKLTDFTYLRDLGSEKKQTYSYEEAVEVANKKNTDEVAFINKKMQDNIDSIEYHKKIEDRKNARINKIS